MRISVPGQKADIIDLCDAVDAGSVAACRGEMDVQILCFPIRELARNCRFEVSTFDDLPARHHPRSVKAAHGECAFAKLFRHLSNGVEVSSPRRM